MRILLLPLVVALALLLPAQADPHFLTPRNETNPGFQFYPSPDDWRTVNMYQLFTDRFFDGDAGNNLSRRSTSGTPWYNEANRSDAGARHLAQGGDWRGIRLKLDYLTGMGVNAVWISSVQRNEQGVDKRYTPYHAYHPTDFYRTEPLFGDFAELKALVDEAHAAGVYVIIDVVINHTADLLGLGDGRDDRYHEFGGGPLFWWDPNVRHAWPFDSPTHYNNNGRILNWERFPEYLYGAFVGTDDLKTDTKYVQDHLIDIFKNLISATDCDGFRVDAIKHVEFEFVMRWADEMRAHARSLGKDNFLIFGENFSYSDAAQTPFTFPEGRGFNSTLWFPMQMALRNVFAYEQGTRLLGDRIRSMPQYGEGADNLVAFLDNHDVDRIALEAGSEWERKLRPALTFLYTGTPVPCLFYGTEHGFNQGNRRNLGLEDGDYSRENMWDFGFQWGNAQGDKFHDSPLRAHIRKLNELRAAHPSLTMGNLTIRWEQDTRGLFAYSRVYSEEEALVVLNTDWSNRTESLQVGKPDGTLFTNLLNPMETATVANGRLAVTVGSKDSKIFVAGSVQQPSEATLTWTSTDITITYSPNEGPLEDATGSLLIGLRRNGAAEEFFPMIAANDGAWTYTQPFAGLTGNLVVTFRDTAAPPKIDNRGGSGWSFDSATFGRPLIEWVGDTVTWPVQGEITPGDDLWVDVKSYPRNVATGGRVVFTTGSGETAAWEERPLVRNGFEDNDDRWHVNLGRFPAGTNLRFSVEMVDANGLGLWDNNAGLDFLRTIQLGTTPIEWMGNTRHWPRAGEIEPGDDLWVDVESYPLGAGVEGEVIYSLNDGESWSSATLLRNGTEGNNDLWHVNLGAFAPGTPIRFAVRLTDTTGVERWDSNNNEDYLLTVNGLQSGISFFSDVRTKGRVPAVRPDVSLKIQPDGSLALSSSGRNPANLFIIQQSDDLVSWADLRTIPAGSAEDVWDLLAAGDIDGRTRSFFRVEARGGETDQVFADNPVSFSVRSYPPGGAERANLVYSSDGGATWLPVTMERVSSDPAGDLWAIEVPGRSSGALFKYAIELIDKEGVSVWANNEGNDYTANVITPGQTDVVAPEVSHSPSNTVTSATSLLLTLTATDDQDPAPRIHFTTDGTIPSRQSPSYTGPINITADTTVRYLAVDAAGNRSEIKSVEVRVNVEQNFGPNLPYSTNPTLGQSVVNGSIVIDGANSGEWTDQNLIAIGMANDDPRSLGSNWTMHEAPINLTHLWAAWDDTYLYLAWQYVDVTDVIDPANAGGAGSGRIGNNDGILQWIALDTNPATGSTHDMWGKNNGNALWVGANKPDVQIYLAGSLWQGFVSRAVNGVFPVDDDGVNYFTIAQAEITAEKGATFAGTSLWGVSDTDDRRNADAPTRNFLTEGHNTARDSFYEMRVPLAFLGLTRAQLESQGIGVMVGAGSMSAMDVLPQDDGATLDTPGVESYNSSFEWGDTDRITVPFARIGAW